MRMSTIVAGIFETHDAATHAAQELQRAGFEPTDLEQFVLSPPGRHNELPTGGDELADAHAKGGEKGAVGGAAIGSAVGAAVGVVATPLVGPAAIAGGALAGAYVGSLAGAGEGMKDKPQQEEPITRPFGVMLAVNAEVEEDQEVAVNLMRVNGAQMIERADGSWLDGHWATFDPLKPPKVIEQKAA
jgi:hypothetical protein